MRRLPPRDVSDEVDLSECSYWDAPTSQYLWSVCLMIERRVQEHIDDISIADGRAKYRWDNIYADHWDSNTD